MRNWRELSASEVEELGRLYPVTPDARLSADFDISIETIRYRFARPLGWKKDMRAVCYATHGTYRELSEEEEAWIVRHYKHTRNGDIMEKFGIGTGQLSSLRRKYGLKKSAQFMRKSREQAKVSCKAAFHEYGESERARERAREQWAERRRTGDNGKVGFQRGESNKTRLSREEFLAVMEKIRRKRNESIRRDRVRIHWGMEPKTRLVKNWDSRPDWHKRHYRHLFREYRYVVEDGSSTVYYDDNTIRRPLIEERAAKYGMRVKPFEKE